MEVCDVKNLIRSQLLNRCETQISKNFQTSN